MLSLVVKAQAHIAAGIQYDIGQEVITASFLVSHCNDRKIKKTKLRIYTYFLRIKIANT